jgi:hypothetical protein
VTQGSPRVGEEVRPPKTVDETRLRDEMRTWFEREMGSSE